MLYSIYILENHTQSSATTVSQYLASLPKDRRDALGEIRKTILQNLPKGYEEVMDFGMIAYVIPLKRFPNTYNGHALGLAALASQKNYMSIYLMNVYGDPATEKWFKAEWKKTGKKIDMGKSCVRFKKLEDLPLDLIGKAVARTSVNAYITRYKHMLNLNKK